MFGRERFTLKDADQVRAMRAAGLVVADALAAVRAAARPGVTTAELDAVAAAVIAEAGATPSFVGVDGGPGVPPYPATTCISVNDEIVHGIPGDRVLEPGDVLSVDCGAILEGWHGDSAFSMVLDPADPADVALVETTEAAMWAGIAALATGDRLGVVGDAVEATAKGAAKAAGVRYGVVQEYTGHGIGREMHEPPTVLNYRSRERGPRVQPGLCVAIEPMLTRGTRATDELDDGWTVVTFDGSRAAHWEHSVAVTPGGVWVLTAHDGGAERLGALGVPVAPWTE
ncbi:type I methionyl aminopeptidase [Actinotalea fermentans]|uniref:Methionine aminopeptidase n=1 Tax=Actinotalea fermentans TaxID=43671 RepID=A0A511Z065_9CELL|nr:type I methionyl aminopeptidase [Actinotalea fermentans]KGM17590.1 methionine aminopeptidase [Actinotalea fermentans ATCC 43279 = JCM 9966 = DSM 3133]GEN80829.1 methionine aminopeptidase [Actinotalea fermentans]